MRTQDHAWTEAPYLLTQYRKTARYNKFGRKITVELPIRKLTGPDWHDKVVPTCWDSRILRYMETEILVSTRKPKACELV